jgi:hypothetical protein
LHTEVERQRERKGEATAYRGGKTKREEGGSNCIEVERQRKEGGSHCIDVVRKRKRKGEAIAEMTKREEGESDCI